METTTEKVQSLKFNSRRNVVSDGAFLTDDGRLFDACAKATWGGTVAERWTWLCQQNADGVEYRHQMSGEGSQQGTAALFHEDSGRPERVPALSTNGAHGAMTCS